MNCLRLFQSPCISHPVPSSIFKHNNQPWLPATHLLQQPLQQSKKCHGWKLGNTTRTQAMLNSYLDSLVLGVATAKRGDISVLLPTGGLMLFFYVIANFVFPHFLMKYYKSEAAAEDDDNIFPDKD
ncbi:hypothetical protein LINPERPRIM_LOCUS38637 [Linum perenne]